MATPTDKTRDNLGLVGPGPRLTKAAKKKPAKKTGAMGAPKKAVKRKTAKKTSKKK